MFNRSPRFLRWSAIVIATGWILGGIATAYFVAQYFVCIGNCAPGTPTLALLATSTLLGLVPAVLTLGLGFFVVRGLWEDARTIAAEEAEEAQVAAVGSSPQPAGADTEAEAA